jgi:hypothetical protein
LKAPKSRATSVNSSLSKPSKGSSDSSGSGSKCKPSPAPTPKPIKKTPKSAKFSDGIPDNEGKTASTQKQAKENKRESYAEKATKGKKKSWIYTMVMEYKTRVGKRSNVTSEMYSCQAAVLRVFQEHDSECAIGDHINAKAEPLLSPGEFKFKSHAPYMHHYKLDYEPDWQWDAIKGDKPHNFNGSFILLSDKPPQEILSFTRVDLRNNFQGSINIKESKNLTP